MPRYWDREGNEMGFRQALKFQAKDPKGFAEAQKFGRMAKRAGRTVDEVGDTFAQITLTPEGQISSPNGGGSVAGANARVESSGNRAIASRRTMMRTVTPLAVLGQKKMTSDTRQCFLVIEGRGWALTQPLPVDFEGAARSFAAKVNAAAAAAAAEPADVAGAGPAIDITEQIQKLAALKDQGILTEDEFAAKKAELLARM
jgi:hypothetical protein